MIITRAPYRISLVGGGTDFPEFFEKHGGAVVSFAIDKHIYTCMSPRFEHSWRVSYTELEVVKDIASIKHDIVRECLIEYGIAHPVEIVTIGDLPGKSGIGSSSAMANSMIKAIRPNMSAGEVSEAACTIEIERCHSPIGVQDQYTSAFGGLNMIEFSADCVTVAPITSDVGKEIARRIVLVHTGDLSDSRKVLAPMQKQLSRKTYQLCQMREIARSLFKHLCSGRYDVVGEALQENWDLKKQLSDNITTPRIDELYSFCLQNGATAGKIVGSGGGGFLLLWCDSKSKREELIEVLSTEHLQTITCGIDAEGVTVVHQKGAAEV
jgi:D-glycero-alpha-D-manno-heptose-7-phosphate kinase